MKHLFTFLILITFTVAGNSQQKTAYKIKRAGVSNNVGEDFNPVLQNIEMPAPGSNSARRMLLEMKEEMQKKYSNKNAVQPNNSSKTRSADTLTKGMNFQASPSGSSVPNDNNMAISNDGILLSAINSYMVGYDTEDSAKQVFSKSLSFFAQPLLIGGSKFDPKLAYDPKQDKFIAVFLNGFTPSTSKIIIAFSSTNDPNDPWYFFALSGNPLNDNTWSDYPAIAITEDELFLTINQIIPDSSWQTGFSQTLIWQMDKNAAFAGDTIIDTQLWTGVDFGGKPIRNLNPIKGGFGPKGPNMHFVSNRNFALQNDTIFMVEITDNIASGNAEMKIKYGLADVPYGVPPFARQASGHTFDTNDGRLLGGFIENGKIQFVGNCAKYIINGNDTFVEAGVYHGIIDSIEKDVPAIRAHIIHDPDTMMDFGYPNISFMGNQYCEDEAVITFNHSGPNVFSGSSAIYYSNNGEYSDLTNLKQGDDYVNILPGTYERWGDYSGTQRKFDEPGTIWVSTSWGNSNKRNATWITQLTSPDTSHLQGVSENIIAATDTINMSQYGLCDGASGASAIKGIEPYTYHWNDPDSQMTAIAEGLCAGTYKVTITDAHNCTATATTSIEQPLPKATMFPNPTQYTMTINFTLQDDATIDAGIYNMEGKLIQDLMSEKAKKGANLFSFSTAPLAEGIYILRLRNTVTEENIFTEKFLKQHPSK